jgi:protein-tyrosine phosphatase
VVVVSEFDVRSVVNGRDLGGLPLAAGGATRLGVLLRSDAPYTGDRAPRGLQWPPSTVLDLRDSSEAGEAGAAWPDTVRRISNPLFSGLRMDRVVQTSLIDLYSGMVQNSGPQIVMALNRFDLSGPTLVHCAAGKDRTGVVVALALLLAGVETEAIIVDYQLTEAVIAGVYARLDRGRHLPAGITLEDPIFRTPREAIELVIDQVSAASGAAWGWFEANGGDVPRFTRWAKQFCCTDGLRDGVV